MPRRISSVTVSTAFGLAVVLSGWGAAGQQGARNGEWRNHGGDKGHTQYSALDQINKENIDDLVEEIYKPVRTYMEHKDKTTTEDVNPYYILPKMFQMRLQKIMDEYVAGVSTYYQTNKILLEEGLKYLMMLKEDSEHLRAKDLHELLRAWENNHRMWTAEAHLRHILFREETRYPGFYYRADFLDLDEENWHCFVNSRYDPETGDWDVFKREWTGMVDHGH